MNKDLQRLCSYEDFKEYLKSEMIFDVHMRYQGFILKFQVRKFVLKVHIQA